jgi:hypothetical protein
VHGEHDSLAERSIIRRETDSVCTGVWMYGASIDSGILGIYSWQLVYNQSKPSRVYANHTNYAKAQTLYKDITLICSKSVHNTCLFHQSYFMIIYSNLNQCRGCIVRTASDFGVLLVNTGISREVDAYKIAYN